MIPKGFYGNILKEYTTFSFKKDKKETILKMATTFFFF